MYTALVVSSVRGVFGAEQCEWILVINRCGLKKESCGDCLAEGFLEKRDLMRRSWRFLFFL